MYMYLINVVFLIWFSFDIEVNIFIFIVVFVSLVSNLFFLVFGVLFFRSCEDFLKYCI